MGVLWDSLWVWEYEEDIGELFWSNKYSQGLKNLSLQYLHKKHLRESRET